MGLFDFFKKKNKQEDLQPAKSQRALAKEEVDELILSSLNILCDEVSTKQDVHRYLVEKGCDARQAALIAERAQMLNDKHLSGGQPAEAGNKTTGKRKTLNEVYAEKKSTSSINDAYNRKPGVEDSRFSSEQFQKECIALAQATYFQNGHDLDKVKQTLRQQGLSEEQASLILDKFLVMKTKMVEDFDAQLHSGRIQSISISPNPEHKPGSVDQEQVSKYIGYGAFQMERGAYENALELLNKAIELDKTAVLAYANLGSLYSRMGDPITSLKYYDIALGLDPGNAKLYTNKALVLAETGQPDQAMACYQKAIALDGSDVQALNNLGILLVEQEQYGEAIKLFDKVLNLDAQDADAGINKLHALAHVDVEEAIAFYNRLRTRHPGNNELHYVIPSAFMRQNRKAEALDFINELFNETADVELLKVRSRLCYPDDKQVALSSIKDYLKAKPNDMEGLELKMQLAYEMIETEGEAEFVKSVEECLSVDKHNLNALGFKTQFLLKENDMDGAIQSVNTLFEHGYSEQFVIGLILRVYDRIQRVPEALSRFEDLASRIDDKARYQLGYVKGLYLKDRNLYEEAIGVFSELNTESQFAWNYYQIAIIENIRGDTAACIRNLRKTFALDPSLKQDAREYVELENLRDHPEFQALVR